jgi:hypothetical protein
MAGIVKCSSTPTRVGPPQTIHTVSVSTSSDKGTQANPAIITYVCQPCGDTMTWLGASLTVTWTTTPNPYPHTSSTSASRWDSGVFTAQPNGSSWGSNQQFDYTVMVGSYGPIYGRIIIKP